ncbi:acyl-CoA N-acyltransferase [Trichoderma novae-zelandiae]
MPSIERNRILPSPCPPSSNPGTVLVETERLIIRRYLISDAPALALAANHEQVASYMSDRFASPYTTADAEKFIQQTFHNDDTAAYPHGAAILLKPGFPGNSSATDALLIGGIGTRALTDILYRTWDLGYYLSPSVWRQGYGTEALRGFTTWAFETWPMLNRIQAHVYESNAASQKLLQKCGFVLEGRGRGAVEKGGQIMDEVLFGLLRDDLKSTT